MDFPKMDFANNEIEDYYSAINAVLSLVVNHCFIKGVIETYLFVIDTGGKVFSLPLDALGKIISKLAVIYSKLLGEMLILNSSYFVRGSYWAARNFIHEDTRNKITLLGSDEMNQIYNLVDPSQLF